MPEGILKLRKVEDFWQWLVQCDGPIHVALRNGVLVGFVTTCGSELDKLYVAQEARGTGVATSLLRHAEDRLRDRGAERIFLFCTAGNHRAERFYEREGWVKCETRADCLWLPPGTKGDFFVQTHRFIKHVGESRG